MPLALAKLAMKYFGDDGLLSRALPRSSTSSYSRLANLIPDLNVGDDVLAYLAELRDAEARRRKIAEAFPKGIRSAAFKDLLKVPLYDYQREGACSPPAPAAA